MLRKPGVVVAVIAIGGLGASARAELIGLELLEAPDVFSGFIDVSYNALSDLFVADGFALTLDDGITVPPADIDDGLFNLSAQIDDQGFALAGALTIEGNVNGFGSSLLTADLTDFGFSDDGGQLLEFAFEVTGGDLAPAYGGTGAILGVIMDIGTPGYSGDWSQGFDNLIGGLPGTGGGVADAAPVPVPPRRRSWRRRVCSGRGDGGEAE